MEAKLVVVGGDVKTSEVTLRLPCIIGRGRGSGVVLPHPLVSRQHCELFEKNGQLMVRDLGSLNGTYINNTRLTEPTKLPAGDLLTIGTVTFRAEYGPASKRSSAETPTLPRQAAKKAPPEEEPDFLSDDDADEFLSLDELNETSLEDLDEADETPASSAKTEDLDDDIMSYLDFGDDEKPKSKSPAKGAAEKPGKGAAADRRKSTGGDDSETLRAPGKPRDDRRG